MYWTSTPVAWTSRRRPQIQRMRCIYHIKSSLYIISNYPNMSSSESRWICMRTDIIFREDWIKGYELWQSVICVGRLWRNTIIDLHCFYGEINHCVLWCVYTHAYKTHTLTHTYTRHTHTPTHTYTHTHSCTHTYAHTHIRMHLYTILKFTMTSYCLKHLPSKQ